MSTYCVLMIKFNPYNWINLMDPNVEMKKLKPKEDQQLP